jgi:hypothetical protein
VIHFCHIAGLCVFPPSLPGRDSVSPFVHTATHSSSKTCNQTLFHFPMSRNLIDEIPSIPAPCELNSPCQQVLLIPSDQLFLFAVCWETVHDGKSHSQRPAKPTVHGTIFACLALCQRLLMTTVYSELLLQLFGPTHPTRCDPLTFLLS